MIAPAQNLVIVGSGLAAWTVVRELRKLDAHTSITLVTRDNGDFYSKPMLSNALSSGKTAAQLVSTTSAAMAEQHGVKLMAHTEVTAIDPVAATDQHKPRDSDLQPPGVGPGGGRGAPAFAG